MENEKKTEAEILSEKLLYKKPSAFEKMTEAELREAADYADGYAEFLFRSKTEREAVKTSVELLKQNGFVPYSLGDKVHGGGKYYFVNRSKGLFAFTVGSEDINCGVRVMAAHIDSPRLDLKPHPLFEDTSMAYLKTHYYGGTRKYQWPTLPLALHGVVTKKNGETAEVNIGEDEGDPMLVITDLPPHIAKEQGSKTLNTAFNGEVLNILAGTEPLMEDGKPAKTENSVKLNIMKLLNEKYGIVEEDFVSAELCAVPAGKPVNVGLDRSLLGAYGHDDKVCAYPALTALIDKCDGRHTVICALADKEETGSDGITGMQCSLLSELIDEIAKALGGDGSICRHNSLCISADVTVGYDPNYPEVFEKRNSAVINCGVAIAKYTGSGGKYSTNDASAETVGRIRRMLDGDGVLWQTAELGKIDVGGGGTVAKYIANRNIETIDAGVPVLSMHAPFELISKYDLYSAYKAFLAFCK